METVNPASTGGDLSLTGLFLQADWIAETVMLLLIAASVWVWAIVFEKSVSLSRANRAAALLEDRFWSGSSLDALYRREGERPNHPIAAVFGAVMGEWLRSAQVVGADMSRGSVRERVDRAVSMTVMREMERMKRWMVFLACVGSTAPSPPSRSARTRTSASWRPESRGQAGFTKVALLAEQTGGNPKPPTAAS